MNLDEALNVKKQYNEPDNINFMGEISVSTFNSDTPKGSVWFKQYKGSKLLKDERHFLSDAALSVIHSVIKDDLPIVKTVQPIKPLINDRPKRSFKDVIKSVKAWIKALKAVFWTKTAALKLFFKVYSVGAVIYVTIKLFNFLF